VEQLARTGKHVWLERHLLPVAAAKERSGTKANWFAAR